MKGALPDSMIEEMIEAEFILNADKKNINPSSLDLGISKEIYRVEGIFQPRPDESVRCLMDIVECFPHGLGTPLEKGVTYLVALNEKVNLPKSIYGYCNPKSSSGRNDVHVRVLADGVPRYDALTPSGYKGDLWLAIHPRSFPIFLEENETLIQLRFFNSDTRFIEAELQILFEKYQLLWYAGNSFKYEEIKITDSDGSIILTLDLSNKELVGYRCTSHNHVLDFSKRDYNSEYFFEPVKMDRSHIRLKAGEFYIFSTREAVRVPPDLACEMVPMDERSGEFRSHYAGFIDSGWGWGENGEGQGRPLTLELRPFEDLIVRDNQPVAKIRFERMIKHPDILYDQKSAGSHYVDQQGPRLSKQFKE